MLNLRLFFAGYFLLNLAFQTTSFANDSGTGFYSVIPILSSLTVRNIGTYSDLSIKPPEYLYHWISFKSLNSLFSQEQSKEHMPLKLVGTHEYQSLIVQKIPDLTDASGLFTWHSPLAFFGGSSEIYGNGEALLELKVNPNSRVGVVITGDVVGIQKLNTNSEIRNYDLILHINGTDLKGTILPLYIEWVVLNPKAILSVKADPKILAPKLEAYAKALDLIANSEDRKNPKNAEFPDIQLIAGPHHNGDMAWALNARTIRERITGFIQNEKFVPLFLKGNGLSFNKTSYSKKTYRFCHQFYKK